MKRLALNHTHAALQSTRRRREGSHHVEDRLIAEKAETLDNGALANEIARSRRGIEVAANKTASDRFARRLAIMQAEADKRMAAAGAGGDR
jgi:hypothetical protein